MPARGTRTLHGVGANLRIYPRPESSLPARPDRPGPVRRPSGASPQEEDMVIMARGNRPAKGGHGVGLILALLGLAGLFGAVVVALMQLIGSTSAALTSAA